MSRPIITHRQQLADMYETILLNADKELTPANLATLGGWLADKSWAEPLEAQIAEMRSR